MADVEFVVYLEGELDIATIPAVRDEWLAVIDDVQPDLLVIDLSAVTFPRQQRPHRHPGSSQAAAHAGSGMGAD
jgi:hypothetical protein